METNPLFYELFQTCPNKDLELLFEAIFDFKNLNAWIDSPLPAPQNDPSLLANLQN